MKYIDVLAYVISDSISKNSRLKRHSKIADLFYVINYKMYDYPIVYSDGLISARYWDYQHSLYQDSPRSAIGLLIKGYIVLNSELFNVKAKKIDAFCQSAKIFGLRCQLPPLKLMKYIAKKEKKINKQLLKMSGHCFSTFGGTYYRCSNSFDPKFNLQAILDGLQKYSNFSLVGLCQNSFQRINYSIKPHVKTAFRPVFRVVGKPEVMSFYESL